MKIYQCLIILFYYNLNFVSLKHCSNQITIIELSKLYNFKSNLSTIKMIPFVFKSKVFELLSNY